MAAIQSAREGRKDMKAEEGKVEEKGVGRFMRSGKTGGWRGGLSDDQVRRIEEWEARHLKGSDLTFTYSM